MFGSTNTFGQSSSNPFSSQSGFGQNNNASSNPFAPKPFGSVTPFGSQTGDSNFGSTSTGVFGATQASSAPVFGVSSSPAFGSSITPAFGASSTPAFGSSSSSFGGSSAFGQKPAFGGFGSPTTQTTPFGSTFQQSQPAFGNSLFGSSTIPFGVSSQSAFSAPSNQAFGGLSSSIPAFGATNMQVFGNQTFGSTGNAFGVSSTAPAFGGPATRTPSFGGPSNPSFSFGSTPAFSQSTSAFGISPTPFVAQTSLLGAQTTAPTFGSPGFGPSAIGGQRGGSRVATYAPTAEVDGGTGTHTPGKLVSISAMPVYKDKSHEELRWEDYQQGDKGGPSSGGQSTGATGFGTSNTQVSSFSSSSTFGQPSANQFPSATATNPFAPKTTPSFGTPGFGPASSPAFGTAGLATSSITANPFGSSSIATPSIFGSSNPTSGASTSATLFGSPGSSAFGSSTSIFSSTSTPTFNSGLNFGNTPSSPLFQSTAPPVGQSSSFGSQIASSFGQSTSAFSQASLFSTPSTGIGGSLFSSSQSLLQTNSPMGGFGGQTVPSLSASFQPAQPSQGAFGVGNFGQIQGAGLSGFGTLGTFAQSNIGQLSSSTQHTAVVQAAPISNPFGTLPAMPQMSIAHAGTSPSIQYGISSLPTLQQVVDNPAPARVTSFLTSRQLSQRRITLPARKYRPKNDGPKVSFFSDDEETPGTPKADVLFIPRENPRALVIHPNLEQWSGRAANGEKRSPSRDATPAHANGDDDIKEQRSNNSPVQSIPKTTNGVHDGSIQKVGVGDSSYITLTGHRAGEAAIVYEHGADVEALMPKLRHSDYYTEPRIQELAAKERAAPGFCRCVKDFVVGRHGYGSIMFLGETDVRRLDLESLIQFNHREVIVYMDESKKPPVGQGLNKHAVVTLLNIKCFDKKTGSHHTQGPKIDKYKEMLRKKAEDQGTDFVSYDPINGEWKFKVNHFSAYRFGEEEEEEEAAH